MLRNFGLMRKLTGSPRRIECKGTGRMLVGLQQLMILRSKSSCVGDRADLH